MACSNSQIYDVPPDLAEVYDLPKSGQATKGFEEERKQTPTAVDIQQITDDEAEEMLDSYCKLVKVTYENLFQTVYGSDAYWGTDNMPRRNETLQLTIQASRQFDRALRLFLEFGKGVANSSSLESSHDMNFKKKCTSHYRELLHKHQEILPKIDALSLNNETTTATVKSLLENARVIPNSVDEFAVLVKFNKALLFHSRTKPTESLPVITKSEVKARPLPELPPVSPNLHSSSYRSSSPQPLQQEERELLERFSKQMELITPSLRESVDVLLDSINVNEAPKEFVTKSKLTVVEAYKLVYVADALCQQIIHNETKAVILSSSNLLTESIKGLISDTKSAALQYPSVLALERMRESLKRIFPSALDLVEAIKSRATLI